MPDLQSSVSCIVLLIPHDVTAYVEYPDFPIESFDNGCVWHVIDMAVPDSDNPFQTDPPPPYSPPTTIQRSSSSPSIDKKDAKEDTTIDDGIPDSDRNRIARWAEDERDRIYRWAKGEEERITAIKSNPGDEEVKKASRRVEMEVDDGLRRVEKQAREAINRAKKAVGTK